MVEIKNSQEVDKLRAAAKVVAKTLALLKKEIRVGISTEQLDKIARKKIEDEGAKPGFLGYRGYPATVCVSINEEVVHGIPSKRIIKNGDIVSFDVGAIVDGFYGDAAITVPVGKVKPEYLRLIDVTRSSLNKALAVIKDGVRLGDVSYAVQEFVEKEGMSVVKEFTGHGIGRKLHEDPSIPNFGIVGKGLILRSGMTLAIEPMVCLGKGDITVLKDGWTAVSSDGSYSAHFEHDICVTDLGCEILSKA
ncbi:MAG: type I methionyl aminopeptidase [Elusimicrobiales bacterium]|nr:type I methionyl aminopeptidase [Elusimicrobiales bacterium]MCK5106787.1 type I methionyl aminopeptidase [Elusimicrobiales bacterium]MCK5584111.1 type I methionyl aminopeptidase [Elusimicrobiales bacterium]